MTPFVVAGVFVALATSALVGWRWWLIDRAAGRAHELEVTTRRVVIDQARLDAALAKVGQLEERVKTLEYRPIR